MESIIIFLSLVASMLWPGVLPPQVVQGQRYQACLAQGRVSDVVRIKVLQVDSKVTWCPRDSRLHQKSRAWHRANLVVLAQVVAVRKSASGLKLGSRLRLAYRVWQLCPRIPGPSNRPQPMGLSQGSVVWAFLRRHPGKPLQWPWPFSVRKPVPWYDLDAGALSFVVKEPTIMSEKQWIEHCDRLFPGRRRRPRQKHVTARP
ncbi:MAG: hypothetical protein J7M25_10960 [Deltaproteobacteria bacterium]|nr:hypothetical protein [Deltaproteobacteria bacterium]